MHVGVLERALQLVATQSPLHIRHPRIAVTRKAEGGLFRSDGEQSLTGGVEAVGQSVVI
ncbi:hypothetical protein SDC9_197659 [bioreactor metagenome]|uniref:Uncharacterized protein n=1 Tax=bioreactor metagenome TaxID=1076179 RepID=A0A645INW4_9ZZZZ